MVKRQRSNGMRQRSNGMHAVLWLVTALSGVVGGDFKCSEARPITTHPSLKLCGLDTQIIGTPLKRSACNTAACCSTLQYSHQRTRISCCCRVLRIIGATW